jgi:hypothetical protein
LRLDSALIFMITKHSCTCRITEWGINESLKNVPF